MCFSEPIFQFYRKQSLGAPDIASSLRMSGAIITYSCMFRIVDPWVAGDFIFNEKPPLSIIFLVSKYPSYQNNLLISRSNVIVRIITTAVLFFLVFT